MSTIRGVKDRRFNFVQLLNSMFEDPLITLKAKGFIGYCLTKPTTWKFHISQLCTVLKEGERALHAVVNECVEHGYAYRYQPRAENGDFLPWETIVSDSKFEIEQVKNEIELLQGGKKMFTERCFAHAQLAHAQNSGTSNMECRHTKEEQQQAAPAAAAAVPFSHPNFQMPERKNQQQQVRIHPMLDSLDIPLVDKKEITQRHDPSTIDNAVGWATHKDNPPTKCLAASIKYACNNSLTPKEFDREAKKSPYERVSAIFTNGELYNEAICCMDQEAIAFYRGFLTEHVKFDKFFTWKKLEDLCKIFNIPLPENT